MIWSKTCVVSCDLARSPTSYITLSYSTEGPGWMAARMTRGGSAAAVEGHGEEGAHGVGVHAKRPALLGWEADDLAAALHRPTRPGWSA
jgi:hypothetical protein